MPVSWKITSVPDSRSRLDPAHVLRHRDAVLRMARRHAARPDLAEDLAQEALLVALSSAPPVRSSVERWLAGVVARLSARGLRSERRRARRERATARPERLPSAADVAAGIEQRRRLLAAFERLSEPYRTVLYLRYFEALPPRDVALRLDRPVETVRSQVRRGLERLRAELVGDRRSGLAAIFLGPLAQVRRSPYAASSLFLRGLLMKKFGTALALVLVTTLAVWLTTSKTESPPRHPESASIPSDPARERTNQQRTPREVRSVAVAPHVAGARLRGVVRDADTGEPLAGVSVVLAGGGAVRMTTTGHDGEYRFEELLGAEYLLGVASDSHYLPAQERHRLELAQATSPHRAPIAPPGLTISLKPTSDERRDLLLTRGFTLSGIVLDANDRPVEGAVVTTRRATLRSRVPVRGLPDELRPPRTRSGADGRFTLGGIVPDVRFVAYATHEGRVGVPSRSLRLLAGRPSPEVELRMVSAPSLAGRVMVGERPAAHATVSVEVADRELAAGVADMTADADGHFRFDALPPGRPVTLTATLPGHARSRSRLEALTVGERRDGVLLHIEPGVEVSGVLVDDDGAPVADHPLSLGTTRRGGPSIDVRTGSDGRFRFAGAPAEEVSVSTIHTGGVRETLTAPFEAPRTDLEVRLHGRVDQLEVAVVDADGRLVPRAELVVVDEGMAELGPAARLRSRSRHTIHGGSATIAVRHRGPLTIEARDARAGAEPASAPASVTLPTELPPSVQLVLPVGVTVQGSVTTNDGRPVEGVAVMGWRKLTDAGPAPESALRRPDVRARTDAGGRFVLSGLPDGSPVEVLVATPPGHVRLGAQKTRAGSGEELHFELVPAAAIVGRVVREDGSAVTRGRVEAYLARKTTAQPGRLSSALDADGGFRIDGVPPGVTATLRAESTEPTDRGVLAPAVLTDVHAGSSELVVRLERGVTITGRITDSDGEPFTDCVVAARIEREQGTYATVEPAADGTFALPVARPGTYTVRGMRGSSITAPVRVEAPAEGVELVVPDRDDPNGRPIAGRVLLPDGSPATRGQVHLSWSATAASRAGRTSAGIGRDGRFVTKPLPTDVVVSLRALVADRDHRSEHAPGRLDGVRPGDRDVVVQLRAGYVIEGRLLDATGDPLAGVAVRADPVDADGAAWAATRTDSDGRFRLVTAHAGEHDVSAFRVKRIGGPERLTAPRLGWEWRLPARKALTVVVTLDGVPAAGALVRVRPTDEREGTPVRRTDDAGRVHFQDVVQDELSVEARLLAADADHVGLATEAAPDGEVTVKLGPALRIDGRIEGADGEPVSGRALRAVVHAEGAGTTARAAIAADGTFTLRALPEGEYRLRLVWFRDGERHEESLGPAVAAGGPQVTWRLRGE